MSPPPPSASRPRAPVMRWAMLLTVSALLHLLVLRWADGQLTLPDWRTPAPPVIEIALQQAPLPLPPVAPAAQADPVKPVPPRRKPKARHVAVPRTTAPLPEPKPAPFPEPAPVVAASDVPAAATVPAEPLPAAGQPGADDGPAAAAGNASTAAQPEGPASTTAPYKISPPPPAELSYDVQALREGQLWHGSGLLRWEATGDTYRASAEASIRLIFKIAVLNSQSEGTLGNFGVEPVLYSEKPFRKSLTNTHFQHESGKISFSASQASYPYLGGEQDRVSVVWQLASIGRGEPSRFKPGAQFDIMVAGARDAEPWHIQVLAEEEIELPLGKLTAWRLARAPRPGSYDARIDIWLAPQRDWYPVRIRYTYANADYLDLSLADVKPIAPVAPP